MDLADPKAVAELPGNSDEAQPCETPPSLSAEEFKQKHPEVQATVTLPMGQNVICHFVDNKRYIMCATKFALPGIKSSKPKPLFCYAGGGWVSDPAKALGCTKCTS